jgi:uncharacterized phiE125 gp8 family phage protein
MTLSSQGIVARVLPPSAEPLTLAETKLFLRVDHANEDAQILEMIVAARHSAEQFLKQSLITQQWKIIFEYIVPTSVMLPMGPVHSILSVNLVSREGNLTLYPASGYKLLSASNKLNFDAPPSADSIEITYQTGYGTASQLPKPIKFGLLNHVAALYDGNDQGGIPDAALMHYYPYREVAL